MEASLVIRIATIHQYFIGIRHSSSAICVSLSATGSIALPKSDTTWKVRAIQPSTTSVAPESTSRPKAHQYCSLKYRQMITGIRRIRKKLSRFGTVRMRWVSACCACSILAFSFSLIRVFLLLHGRDKHLRDL